jgi:hypothetical protein
MRRSTRKELDFSVAWRASWLQTRRVGVAGVSSVVVGDTKRAALLKKNRSASFRRGREGFDRRAWWLLRPDWAQLLSCYAMLGREGARDTEHVCEEGRGDLTTAAFSDASFGIGAPWDSRTGLAFCDG